MKRPLWTLTARHDYPRTPRAPESSCLFSKPACVIPSLSLVLARLVSSRFVRLVLFRHFISLVSLWHFAAPVSSRSASLARLVRPSRTARLVVIEPSLTPLISPPVPRRLVRSPVSSHPISRRSLQSITGLRSRLDRFITYVMHCPTTPTFLQTSQPLPGLTSLHRIVSM